MGVNVVQGRSNRCEPIFSSKGQRRSKTFLNDPYVEYYVFLRVADHSPSVQFRRVVWLQSRLQSMPNYC